MGILFFILSFCLVSLGDQTSFFHPYQLAAVSDNIEAQWGALSADKSKLQEDFVREQFAALRDRIKIARERIAAAEPFLDAQSAWYADFADNLAKTKYFRSEAFYKNLAKLVKGIPDYFLLEDTLALLDRERDAAIARIIPCYKHAVVNGFQSLEDEFKYWLKLVKQYQFLDLFFSADKLADQEQFNRSLLQFAVPLFSKAEMSDLVGIDFGVRSYLYNSNRYGYHLNFSFLFLSLSTEWTDSKDKSVRVIYPDETVSQGSRFAGVTPSFHAVRDGNLVAHLLDHPAGPLSVTFSRGFWRKLMGSTYSSRKNRLVVGLVPEAGDWGTTRWRPERSGHCASLLVRSNPYLIIGANTFGNQ